MPIHKPHTEREAWNYVMKGWMFLLTNKAQSITDIMKKGFYWPLTFYMLFGGGIFSYNYFTADKVSIGEIKKLGEIPASSKVQTALYYGGDPIIINGNTIGLFYDPNFIAYAATNGILFLYDKRTREGIPIQLAPYRTYFEKAKK